MYLFDAAAEELGEGLERKGCGAFNVLGALFALLDVADISVRAGGEFTWGEDGRHFEQVSSTTDRNGKTTYRDGCGRLIGTRTVR